MLCSEYMQLEGRVETKRQAYAYIRLNESRVHVSRQRYDELVRDGYTAMTEAMKALGWHKMQCSVCKKHFAALTTSTMPGV
jgi:hypothetical protein